MTLIDLSERLNTTPTALIRQVDRHTMAVQAWLSSRAPDAAAVDLPGVRLCSTGINVPLLNLALGADFAPDSDADTVRQRIAEVKQFFAARGVPWAWWIGQNPQPPDIGRHLVAMGLAPGERPLPSMVAALPCESPPLIPAAVRVWRASDRADLDAASTIRRVAFRFPDGVALDYFTAMPDSWLNDDRAHLYLAAASDSPAAAIGAMIVREGMPGVYIMATLPDWERRGLGRAIMARLLDDAIASGYDRITLTASSKGAGLYRKFGFARAFDYTLYRPVGD